MSIPDYQAIMLPLLRNVKDGKEYSLEDTTNLIIEQFKLTENEKSELLPSGGQTIISNRVGWARTYLKKAALLESPKRGYLRITERGKQLLSKDIPEINVKTLNQYDEFKEFRSKHKDKTQNEEVISNAFVTPEEAFEYGYQKITENLSDELLEKIKSCSPRFFENLVVELLVKMGYGGSRKEAGEVIGKSGDGGIDGIIKEDRLGLDIIYIQAKRWENVVGRPEIQKFAGALLGQKARKGIFITTSYFTDDADDYANNIESKLILIDGDKLAKLMIEHSVGLNTVNIYEVKKIDNDYFYEEK